jgi:hypothetical protein
MRRTQLYLEEDIWKMLKVKARLNGTTVSDLVRAAVREKYLVGGPERKDAMLAAMGVWRDRRDLPDTQTYLRRLRKDGRLKRVLR